MFSRTVLAVALGAVLSGGLAACSGATTGAPRDDAPSPGTTTYVTTTPTPTSAPVGERPTDAAIEVPENLDDLIASANAATESPGTVQTAPADGADRRVLGADAGWPQCPKGMGIPQKQGKGGPMPTAAAEFVILGVTNGPSFTPNPCLASQVDWVRSRGLLLSAYSVVSWPSADQVKQYGGTGPYDGSTRLGKLRNTGYAAAAYNVRTMEAAGLETPAVWIDVEPVPDFPWSSDLRANAAVVEGVARGYRDAGYRIGYYSVRSLWQRVVGDWKHGGAPEWRAATGGMEGALARCSADWSYGGGPGVIAQWVEDDRDRNVTCPGQGGKLGRWFSRT